MAISYSSEGYKLQPQFADLSRLQSGVLKPLDVTRKISVEYRPLEKLVIPSSRPELVGEGISKGVEALSGGILGGIESAFKEKKEKELYNLKLQQKGETEDVVLDRQKALIDYREGLKNRLPEKAKEKLDNYPVYGKTDENKIDFISPAPEMTKTALVNQITPPDRIEFDNSISAVANQLQNLPLSELSASTAGAPIAKIEKPAGINLTTGYETPTIPPIQLIAPEQEQKAIGVRQELRKTLSGIEHPQISETEIAAQRPGWYPIEKAQSEASREIPGWEPAEIDKSDAKIINGIPYFKVLPRKAITEEAKQAAEARKLSLSLSQQNLLDKEKRSFNNHADVKAFTAPNGMRQSIGKFVRDYDGIVKNPKAAGISDIGLLDMYAKAEAGGRITEGQANLVLHANGIKDKVTQLGMKLVGGDVLPQTQRDQMLAVIAEDHIAQANIANQQVEMARKTLKKAGITDEDSLPQPFILPKTKWEAKSEIDEMKSEAITLFDQLQAAETSHEKNKIELKLKSIYENASALQEKINKSKSAIINLHEMETTPQGWGGGGDVILMQQ